MDEYLIGLYCGTLQPYDNFYKNIKFLINFLCFYVILCN